MTYGENKQFQFIQLLNVTFYGIKINFLFEVFHARRLPKSSYLLAIS